MARVTKKSVTEKAERLIYCGPNISGGALQQFTVFKDGLPTHLNEIFEKCPAIRMLCVPTALLQATRQAMATPGSAAHVAYGQILDFITRGGK